MPGQKRLSLAGIGCGSRTRTYMELAMERKDRYRIAAAADPVNWAITSCWKNPSPKR